MLLFFLIAVFITSGAVAQISDLETCSSAQLNHCVEIVPRTQIGLPRNKEALDAHCRAYNIGMSCMEEWIKRCLPNDGHKFIQQLVGGAKAVMHYLCDNNSSIRKDYLKEQKCWALVSSDWMHCTNEFQIEASEIVDRSQHIHYYFNTDICCARDNFLQCVKFISQPCSRSAAHLLQRLAWVLAQDVAACSPIPHDHCSAPTQYTTPILTMLFGVLIYLPRL